MNKTLYLEKQNIDYILRVSRRSKSIRLSVYHDGRCIVTVPKYTPEWFVERFVSQKSQWIVDKIAHFKSIEKTGVLIIETNKKDYLKNKNQARVFVENKIKQFNQLYQFAFNKISIKNQKTCWGSCSKNKNLNFNYKIVLLPEKLADYIVVHELCHLGELNHSQKFWNLVARTFPDYKKLRQELKKIKVV